ncbi:MAG: hypothetical protein ACE3L7_04135 [Candidatus Pristimantibacillus sp.]
MTVNILAMELKSFLEQEVRNYRSAQNASGEFSDVRVFDWIIPFKTARNQEKQDFPYIVIAPIKGSENSGESIVDVHLSFGVYDKGHEIEGSVHQGGFYDLVNLMRYVQLSLQRIGIIGNQFVMQDDYQWEIPEGQPYPYYVGVAQAKFNIQKITNERESEFLHG